MSDPTSWLPAVFEHPRWVPAPGSYHLRPTRATDVEIDLVAVMGSQPRLWAKYGREWGWPPSTMTAEQDYVDLDRHEQEIRRHESFNYAVLNADETKLVGCVYIDPPSPTAPATPAAGPAAEASWWVVDELAGTAVEAELAGFVPAWVAAVWPFVSVSYPFGESAPPPAAPPGAASSYDRPRTALPEPDRDAARALWHDFLAARPDAPGALPPGALPADALPPVEFFGDSAELADELIGLVLRGVKTATASLLSDYATEGEMVPEVDGYWLACDGTGRPRVVLRTVEVRIGPVDKVDDAFAWDEGEQDRSRSSWLEGHERYWRRQVSGQEDTFTLDAEAVFERFQLVWPEAEVARAAAHLRSVARRRPADVR